MRKIILGFAVVAMAAATSAFTSQEVKMENTSITVFIPSPLNPLEWEQAPGSCNDGEVFCGIGYDTATYGPLESNNQLPSAVQSQLDSTPNYEQMEHNTEIGSSGIRVFQKEL